MKYYGIKFRSHNTIEHTYCVFILLLLFRFSFKRYKIFIST